MLLGMRAFPASTRRNGREIKDFIVVQLQHTSRSFLILAAGLIAKCFFFFFFPGKMTKLLEPNSNVQGLWKSGGDLRLRKTLHRGHLDFNIQTTGNFFFFFTQKSFPPLGYCNQSQFCWLLFSARRPCKELNDYLNTSQARCSDAEQRSE